MRDLKKEYSIFLILPILMLLIAIIIQSPREIVQGLVQINRANNILVSDYFIISNIGATLVNSAVNTLLNIYILYRLKLRLNGLLISALFLITSFSFMGKNTINIIPFYVGILIYSKINNKNLKIVISMGMMSTTLAPLVSSLGSFGFVIAIIISYIMPLISQNTLHFHNGYSLYNTGLAGGLLGIVIYSILKAMGIHFDLNEIYYTEFNYVLYVMFLVYFMSLIIIAIRNDKYIKNNLKLVYKHTGRLVTDFVQKEGLYPSIFNMGTLGLMCMGIAYYYQVFNGPVICSMLTVVAFGGFGKHLKNAIPLIIGVIIADYFFKIKIDTTLFVMSMFFSTNLAPISGKFGILVGIIVGIFQYAVALHIGIVHGGINLYNNGLAAGVVASVVVPIIESILGGLNSARSKKENN